MKSARDFQRQLEAFCLEFRRALPQRIAELEHLCAGLEKASDRPECLRELKRALHSLAGSARTFGVAEVGAAARIAEQALSAEALDDTQKLIATVLESIKVMREHVPPYKRKSRVTA